MGAGVKADNGKKYIKERVQSATWLIKSIQQRQKTIYRVAESIVRYQKDFFDGGIGFLKPLILRDIADDVEMHESTISRVVTNKYMHTPRGTLRDEVLSSAAASTGPAATMSPQRACRRRSGRSSKRKISEKPLSDQEIVKSLQKTSGITIARRTVAKYREMMGVLPSSRRKKYF